MRGTRPALDQPPMYENTRNNFKALGLNLEDVGRHDFGALQGKKSYGQQFETAVIGLGHLAERANSAPVVKSVPANATDGPDALTFDDGQQFMVIDGKVKGLFSGRFNPYQHGDAIDDLYRALNEMGISKVGSNVRFDNDGARLSANVWMPNLQDGASVNVLQDTGEDILLGVNLRNGHDGSSALGLGLTGLRAVCCNMNFWAQDKWGVALSHTNGQMVDKFKAALVRIQDGLKTLPEVINNAKDTQVRVKDLAPIFIATGVPAPYVIGGKRGHSKDIPALGVTPWAYNPDIATRSPDGTVSLWEGYNAGTALLTHAYQGAPSAVERLSSGLGGMLKPRNLDSLITAGTKTLADLAEAAKENTA